MYVDGTAKGTSLRALGRDSGSTLQKQSRQREDCMRNRGGSTPVGLALLQRGEAGLEREAPRCGHGGYRIQTESVRKTLFGCISSVVVEKSLMCVHS